MTVNAQIIEIRNGKPRLRVGEHIYHYSHKPSGCNYHVFEGPLIGAFVYIVCLSDEEFAAAYKAKEITIKPRLNGFCAQWKQEKPEPDR
jgi:hypothetical protein